MLLSMAVFIGPRKSTAVTTRIELPFGKQIWDIKEGDYVAIEATIFRIERRAIEAQRLQSIFTC